MKTKHNPDKIKVFNVDPCCKPRMTRRDKWAKRPCVVKWWAFKDAIVQQRGDYIFPACGTYLCFFIPMPKSWSEKKKKKMYLRPVQMKRKYDIDNLVKAFLDAVCADDDGYVWDIHPVKRWGKFGRIIVIDEGIQNHGLAF